MAERFLIAGGRGPIGSWVARLLLAGGEDPILLDSRPDNSVLAQVVEPGRMRGLRRVFGDPFDPEAVGAVIGREKVTRLIHLAALEAPRRRGAKPAGLAAGAKDLPDAWKAVAAVVHAAPDVDAEAADADLLRGAGIAAAAVRMAGAYGVGCDAAPVSALAALTGAIRAAVLGRTFTIPFRGTARLAYVEDIARTSIAAAREAAAAPGSILRVHADEVAVDAFIAALAEVAPECAGRIASSGDPLPDEILSDPTLLDRLPGGGPLPATPPAEGIRRTAEEYRLLADEGRLQESR
jgi:nucleoside-diphosphate-sugar epimerase